MKVWLVNSKPAQCGIYEFGYELGTIIYFHNSGKHKFHYLEVGSRQEFQNLIDHETPDLVIYNYQPSVLPWLRPDILSCKQALILHEQMESWGWPKIISDPTKTDSEGIFYIGRPLHNANPHLSESHRNVIGSYGLAFHHKGFHKVIEMVGNEYGTATVRIHAPQATFGSSKDAQNVERVCREVAKIYPKLTLEYSNHFSLKVDIRDWLSQNEINVFAYDDRETLAVSSAVDLALESRRPIAVSDSRMFRHLPDECKFSKRSIRTIANAGVKHLEPLYEAWSPKNMVRRFEEIYEKI